MVLADTTTLATLPGRELRAGYAEVVKVGLIGDADFFAWCEQHGAAVVGGDPAAQAEAVLRACSFKAQVVGADEREEAAAGGRALLNLGHTFGHAVEAELGFGTILHGEAVALGIDLAFALSVALGLSAEADRARVRAHLRAVGFEVDPARLGRALSASRLLGHMQRDKKRRDGRLVFVLPRGIGEACVQGGVSEAAVAEVLRAAGCTG
jgi:shikimate kinase/3-dehydroquinate synthase